MRKLIFLIVACLAGSCAQPENRKVLLLRMRLLDRTLVELNDRTTVDNEQKLRELQRTIQRLGNQTFDPAQKAAVRRILAQNDSIHARTQRVVRHMRASRQTMGKPTAEARGIQPAGNVAAGPETRLLHEVAGYYAFLKTVNPAADSMKLLPAEIADSENPAAIARIYFANAAPVEARAALSQIEAKVLAAEAAVLRAQAARVSIETLVEDTIGAFASARSNTVVAGSAYEADLLLVSALKPAILSMTVNGRPIPVADGCGKVVFTPHKARLGKQARITDHWLGTIRARVAGKDSVFSIRVPYTVVRAAE